MNTILELFKLRPVSGYVSRHGEDKTLPMPDLLVGIELEIEGFPGHRESSEFGGFTFTDDGSLRNGGIEAITRPVAIKYVPNLLRAFYQHFHITEANYSERCSTHVHFNVQQLNISQLSTICLVYQTVEKLLFEFVGHERKNNIFCVPWNQSNINYNIVNNMVTASYAAFRSWQKYSALNLMPIPHQGTIEFRHLHGTCDVELIKNWICSIAKIFEYALRTPFEDAQAQITNMNTVSNYRQWLNMVFGEYADKLAIYDGFERDLAVGVIESKLMLTKERPVATTPVRETLDNEDNEDNEVTIDDWLDPPPDPLPVTPVFRPVAGRRDLAWNLQATPIRPPPLRAGEPIGFGDYADPLLWHRNEAPIPTAETAPATEIDTIIAEATARAQLRSTMERVTTRAAERAELRERQRRDAAEIMRNTVERNR